ncbi:MAG TPA: bifunctional transaldolase/phosoglucose isomerase, partial [Nitrolancea sp.]|nr:bifunctional transaldolase/phosoglucose isomerase [Nitrolancea sp.]
MANPLQKLATVGQSFWLDNLSRPLITSGELQRLIRDDGLRGITSNPTIFEKALADSDDYDPEIRGLAIQGLNAEQIFEQLAMQDIREAAQLLRPVFKATEGGDGFVSLELPPYLAGNTETSIREAKRLFLEIGRPNVMIKVPGTPQGIPAIRQLIADGININITLLFSLARYQEVIEAYLAGLEARQAQGLPIDSIASVASFFVSRVDTEVDKRIDALLGETGDDDKRKKLEWLKGRVAVANAKLAYQLFQQRFSQQDARWRRLKEAGARLQRPLWASTSTKNPAYSDIKYVEALIGPDTIDTMPPATAADFRDHGVVEVNVTKDMAEQSRVLETLAETGISYDDVVETLQDQGVAAFGKSFESLLAGIEEKRKRFAGGQARGIFSDQIQATARRLERERAVERLWQKDASLWSNDPQVQQKIKDRLGWLEVPQTMLGEVGRLNKLAEDVRQAGFESAVLLGMGGSSLAPEVFQHTFGNQMGAPVLTVLDTTNPDAIQRLAGQLDLARSLFIVSSKSGTTVETSTLYRYFRQQLEQQVGADAGKHFIAVTDPGTPLEKLAKDDGFRDVFVNPPDIGGRYSALSFFGLVPAAVIGLDIQHLLDRACHMAENTKTSSPQNPALQLGAALGGLAQIGRDKLTFLSDPALASLQDWLEQLIAESTGKDGNGIVPVAHEPHGAPDDYGSDRHFVGIDLAPQPHVDTDAMLAGLETAQQPVTRLWLRDEWDVGAEFFRWEVATALAGAVLGINPFDEPNVQESKDNTNRLLQTYQQEHALPEPPAGGPDGTVAMVGNEPSSVAELVTRFLGKVRSGDYLALMAFCERSPEVEARLQEMRRLLRTQLGVATTLGYGPRFLHSTGQLYKGGPPQGDFLQIVVEPAEDLNIPGEPYSFGTLFGAQS